jgi:hypothetical protein
MQELLYIIRITLISMSALHWSWFSVRPARKEPSAGIYQNLCEIIGTLFALSVGRLNSEKA